MRKILSLVRRCVEDYDMIKPGDRIAVGVSGGVVTVVNNDLFRRIFGEDPVENLAVHPVSARAVDIGEVAHVDDHIRFVCLE